MPFMRIFRYCLFRFCFFFSDLHLFFLKNSNKTEQSYGSAPSSLIFNFNGTKYEFLLNVFRRYSLSYIPFVRFAFSYLKFSLNSVLRKMCVDM